MNKMGSCIGSLQNQIFASRNSNAVIEVGIPNRVHFNGPIKNAPLRHEQQKWKSDQALTVDQVKLKRDEFWDTAPAFDGRKEIWDALRVASTAVENMDFVLAQAIADGANILLPNGTLTDCYDELGTRYQVPLYCLSMPVNIIEKNNSLFNQDETDKKSDTGEEVKLKLRLSNSLKDTKLTVHSNDSIAVAKQKLQVQEHLGSTKQRWYYGGKLLSNKLRLNECNLKPNWVIQCILTEDEITPVDT